MPELCFVGTAFALGLIFNKRSQKYGGKKEAKLLSHRKNICNVKVAAEILGVDESEVERMDKEGAPVMAERLLLLWDRKYINAPGWDGWVFSRGALIHKNTRKRDIQALQHQGINKNNLNSG